MLFLLVDAVAHPRATTDLWTIDAIERLRGSVDAIVVCTGTVAVVLAVASRRRLRRWS